MEEAILQELRDLFRFKENEGEDKVTTLSEAIRSHVRPGMTIQINREATAVAYELTRQFFGQDPNFTLIVSIFAGPVLALVQTGLVKKLVTNSCVHENPAPGPIPLIRNLYRDGKIEIESWTLSTLQQRMMAASLGLGFMPTRLIEGSSIAEDNQECFTLVDDPFHAGQKVGVVKALQPDLSIIHARAADRYGNAILNPPYEDSIWGPRASKNGVVLTVEKLVSTEYIREHNEMVRMPGYLVKAVAVVPFGAHPKTISGNGMKDFEGYGEDYEFMLNFRNASDESSSFDAWIKEWILDCPTYTDYLAKLGYERLLALKGEAGKDTWERQLELLPMATLTGERYNPLEMLVIAAGREIHERILKNGYRTILSGQGISTLAAWSAYYFTDMEHYGLDLLVGSGKLGYAPRPGNPLLSNPANLGSSKMLTDVIDMYQAVVGGSNNRCLSVLSGAQIDKWGNGNSTKISNEMYILGSGGANDAANAQEVVLVVAARKGRFVEKLPFVTFPGKNVTTLVSTEAVLEKLSPGGELTLTAVLPSPEPLTKEARILRAKEGFGWDLKIAPTVEEIEPPSREELLLVRALDPERTFIGK